MTKLQNISKDIHFDGPSHKYHDKNGNSLISVSSLISLYKPDFDPHGYITKSYARKNNMSVEEVKTKWDKIKTDACAKGHDFHSQAEHFIKTGEILDGTYKDVIEKFAQIKFKGKNESEIMLYSAIYKIAGTADLVTVLPDGSLELGDFKTNKEILTKSKYGTKLLYPLDKFDECQVDTYTVQLNLYKYMLEEHGFKVKKITLYHINPETRNIDIYKIPKIDKDIKSLLSHYKKMNEW